MDTPKSKLWFVKVRRELEDPFEEHVRQDDKPTDEQIRALFEEVCAEDWETTGRVECYEVTA